MRISVIIPAYNEEKTIGAAISSLLEQSRIPDEILIINNNSTDRTEEIARSYPRFVRVVNEPQQGLAIARDRGFHEAQGDVLCRTDADTVVPKNWVATIELFFETHPSVLAISGPIVYTERPLRFLGVVPSILYEYLVGLRLGHPVLIGPNMAMRKAVVKKITPCSTRLDIHEDVDLSQHIAALGELQFVYSLRIETSGRRIMRSPFDFMIRYSRMLGNNIAHKRRS